MEEIKITLETLYDILRNEKQREDIFRLNETFFLDVVQYLKEKKKLLESKEKEDDLFAAGEKEKLEYEMRSIKRILKEIYEKREKKMIEMALNRSRTKSDIIDTSILLREEKDFYGQLVTLLDSYRSGVLMSLFKGEIPLVIKPMQKVKMEPEDDDVLSLSEELEPAVEPEITPLVEELKPNTEVTDSTMETAPLTEVTAETASSELPKMKKIRIIHPVPSFVWEDLKEYGPYDIGEEIEMFPEVADLMIEKGRAEEVK